MHRYSASTLTLECLWSSSISFARIKLSLPPDNASPTLSPSCINSNSLTALMKGDQISFLYFFINDFSISFMSVIILFPLMVRIFWIRLDLCLCQCQDPSLLDRSRL